MKTERNILIAFLLNLGFSVFEFFGGVFTGSVAILSDAVHDLGDALGIAVSWFLERKSKHPSDATYTYGYARFSVLGSALTTAILLCGAVLLIHPRAIFQTAPEVFNTPLLRAAYDEIIVLKPLLVGITAFVIIKFLPCLTLNGEQTLSVIRILTARFV